LGACRDNLVEAYMGLQKSRRGFLGMVGAGASATLLLGARHARAEDTKKAEKPEKKTFQGTSRKADFKEALELAVKEAHKSAPAADRLVQWTLKEVSGRDGGISGATELTVTIEASIA
jgi:hypothetical protein